MRAQAWWLFAVAVAAASVWGGVYVYLTVPTVAVPPLTGLQLSAGQEIGERVGLEVDVDERVYHPTALRDTVLSQDPAPGLRVKRGRRLGLTVSRGQSLVPVPALIARTIPYAWLSLDQVRLQLRVTGQQYDEWTQRGVVSRQYPAPGRLVPVNFEIAVIVSLGPRPHVMPDVTGLLLSDALAALQLRELDLEAVQYLRAGDARPGIVLGQHPAPGTPVRRRGEHQIRLVVEAGDEAGVEAGYGYR